MGMLVIILIIGITSAVVAESWKIAAKREKEKELLWRGHQFRLAISRYYQARLKGQAAAGAQAPANVSYYPKQLSDLLKDPASFNTVRYLRKIYTDPMTGKADWALDPPPPPPGGSNITGGTVESGEPIGGVHSVSDAEPLKKYNFDLEDIKFTNISGADRKARYSDWLFDYDPNAPAPNANVVIPTGGTAAPGGGTPGGPAPAGGPAAPSGNSADTGNSGSCPGGL
jgi:type II secretory pathway pseudopilin PulG